MEMEDVEDAEGAHESAAEAPADADEYAVKFSPRGRGRARKVVAYDGGRGHRQTPQVVQQESNAHYEHSQVPNKLVLVR